MFKISTFLVFFIFVGFLPDSSERTIIVFGDSIAAGYGLDSDQAFPAFIQEKVDDSGLNYRVINAGLSGETSAGGLRRVDWILQRQADIFILELGGNDGLRGIDPDLTKQNLRGIMQKVRNSNPDVKILLAGMEAPPNMGDTYTSHFREIFKKLSEEADVFMPFILEDVAGISELNLPDGIHPTEEGHRIIANNLWEYLRPMLVD